MTKVLRSHQHGIVDANRYLQSYSLPNNGTLGYRRRNKLFYISNEIWKNLCSSFHRKNIARTIIPGKKRNEWLDIKAKETKQALEDAKLLDVGHDGGKEDQEK